MSKYTIDDVSNIIPVPQTATVTKAIEDYLNNGVIPDFDPCLSCEPNHTRKLISLIQVAERAGLWPPKRSAKPKANTKTDGELAADGYVAGIISKEERDAMKEKRPELFHDTEEISE